MNREDALRAAIVLTTKDRNITHGDPQENLKLFDDLCNLCFSYKLSNLTKVERASIKYILSKISRLLCGGAPALDNWLDIAAYAAIGAESRDQAHNDCAKDTASTPSYFAGQIYNEELFKANQEKNRR